MAGNKFQTEDMAARCVPMAGIQAVLGGKWKILILWYIAFYQVQRFGQLMRRLDGITQSSLTKQLRELEADGFLIRHDFQEIPPRVEYTLSDLGRSFMDVMAYMKAWGDRHLPGAPKETASPGPAGEGRAWADGSKKDHKNDRTK